jgi:hypothetical protein
VGTGGRAERFADELRISEEVNLRYEYPLKQECLDEITVRGMGTGGLTLKEYDDLLFGEMLSDAGGTLYETPDDRQVDTSLGNTSQERRAARKRLIESRNSELPTPTNSGNGLMRGWEQRADGVWMRSGKTADNPVTEPLAAASRPVNDPHPPPPGGPRGETTDAVWRGTGETRGNDPYGTGLMPGRAQDRVNAILKAPDNPKGNDLTNL